MKFEKPWSLPEKPQPEPADELRESSVWKEEADRLEMKAREKQARAEKLAADAEAMRLMLLSLYESYELSAKDGGRKDESLAILRSITDYENFSRQLESSSRAAESAREDLEYRVAKLRSKDAYFDRLIAMRTKNPPKKQDLH